MGFIANPVSTAGMQPLSGKEQSSGYVGIGSEGQVALGGKFGVNGATPVGKAADMGVSSTSVSIALLTEVAGLINGHGAKLNAIRECLQKAGLMS